MKQPEFNAPIFHLQTIVFCKKLQMFLQSWKARAARMFSIHTYYTIICGTTFAWSWWDEDKRRRWWRRRRMRLFFLFLFRGNPKANHGKAWKSHTIIPFGFLYIYIYIYMVLYSLQICLFELYIRSVWFRQIFH